MALSVLANVHIVVAKIAGQHAGELALRAEKRRLQAVEIRVMSGSDVDLSSAAKTSGSRCLFRFVGALLINL